MSFQAQKMFVCTSNKHRISFAKPLILVELLARVQFSIRKLVPFSKPIKFNTMTNTAKGHLSLNVFHDKSVTKSQLCLFVALVFGFCPTCVSAQLAA